MEQFLQYEPRPAANHNGDPDQSRKELAHIKMRRDQAEEMLAKPSVQGDDRRFMEMYLARANRLLRAAEGDRQEFLNGVFSLRD